jgi:hypothetical protein
VVAREAVVSRWNGARRMTSGGSGRRTGLALHGAHRAEGPVYRRPYEDGLVDPTMLEQLLEEQGPFVIDRQQPTGYMLVLKREDGYVVQGAMWPVEPGLDCATKDALTLDHLAETLAIFDSFDAK